MKYAGYILAAAIAVFAVYARLQLNSKNAELEALRTENTKMREQLEHLARQSGRLSEMEAQVNKLLAQVSDAKAQLEESTAPEDSAIPDSPAQPQPDSGASTPEPEKKEAPLAAMMKMFQGEQGSKMRDASAKMTVDMQYAPLLKQLALPPEIDQHVREILAAQALTEIERGMEIMESAGHRSGKDMHAERDAAVETLRSQLSQVLTADELAQWEAYEADKERHVMAQSFDMQLNMFGGNLDEEARLTLRDTLIDQILVGQEEQALSDEPMEISDHIELQQAAFNRTRELLAPVLTEEQFREADRFITQQEDMLRVSMEMMEGMMGPAGSTLRAEEE